MLNWMKKYSWLVNILLLITAIPILWIGYTSGIFEAMEELAPMKLLVRFVKYAILFVFAAAVTAQIYTIKFKMVGKRGAVAISAATSFALIICSHWVLPNDAFIVVANLMIVLSNMLVFQHARKNR